VSLLTGFTRRRFSNRKARLISLILKESTVGEDFIELGKSFHSNAADVVKVLSSYFVLDS